MKQTKLTSFIYFLSIALLILINSSITLARQSTPLPGAERPELYLDQLQGNSIGIVANQTSILTQSDNKHVVDYLLEKGIRVKKVFVPEHGFRGQADAGEKVDNTVDSKTGLPIISLYGNNKKPKPEQIQDLDILIFDLQDVGVRFYTYISTMHYLMEAAAENGKKVIIFDRPNPNGNYIAGPVLKKGFESFVGMHPIPVVHGLTVGELAQMINGEKWLKGGLQADLEVIPVADWDHGKAYNLPIKPSPNLPNDLSIKLYPSTCFFEGTIVSLGRGTHFPFQVYGYPAPKFGDFTFTPVSVDGMSKNPPHQDKKCYGRDLRGESMAHEFTLEYLLEAYHKSGKDQAFFNNFFNTLAGTDQLKKMIIAGKSEAEISASWEEDLVKYRLLRAKYLMYN
ncbi:uncharacterized protein YbbC (DUF1343 family) [Algoriphagus sp. 4150]|uniref:exo-beta-N-acetylmuramidase NamZ family protein n=1 Tax=Algoriphagus sp. 4150 TaxID=2817756 RepID=UPI002866409E|nr:DUF1343 domain-containing protein [Algoriphagus sp. 4150]MDR7130653.1 uncharacterized protein YbbC (DUF1343 family) [Algoriphagus sp. 4150]